MDEILRHRLERVESPVPDDMWSRIQDARKTNRIHPLGWYYFSASAILVASFALWLTLESPNADIPTTPSETHLLQDNQTAERSSSTSAFEENQEQNRSNSTSNDSKLDNFSKANTQSGQNGNTSTNVLDVQTNTASNKNMNRDGSTKKNRQFNQKSTKTSSGKNATENKVLANQPSTLSGSGSPSGAELDRDQMTNNPVDGAFGQTQSHLDDHPVMELDYRFAAADQLSRNGYPEVTSSSKRKMPGMSKMSKQKSTPTCYSFNSFLRGLSVDAYMAPEYASRQLVYKDPSMVGYAEQRKNDESYVFAFSAGFRVNAHFKGGLALRTGLIYTDIAEKLQYRDENAQITKVINVTLDTIYQNGNIVYIWDTLSVTEYGSYNKVGYNRYRFYDIPLMVGYEIDRGNWVIQLNTGILFNVAASQRGDFLDPDHQLVNFDSNNGQAYKAFRTRVGSSLLMSMGFNYALRPKLHLLVEPQLRVWLQPLNIQSYPVDQKYVNLGLAMGIRQYF